MRTERRPSAALLGDPSRVLVLADAGLSRRRPAVGALEPALIGMNLQFFFDQLVDNPQANPEAAAETLLTIWRRTLYGAA